MRRGMSLLLLPGFGVPLLAPTAPAAQGAPIKIGFLAPLTGPFAQIGKDMVVEDTEGQPATALNKSRKAC